MLKEFTLQVIMPKTNIRCDFLFLVIMRLGAWVAGFGGVEFDIPERHLTRRAPDVKPRAPRKVKIRKASRR